MKFVPKALRSLLRCSSVKPTRISIRKTLKLKIEQTVIQVPQRLLGNTHRAQTKTAYKGFEN